METADPTERLEFYDEEMEECACGYAEYVLSLVDMVIRMDGHDVPEILDAILRVFPLDEAVVRPVNLMAVAEGDTVPTPIWETYKRIVGKYL